MAKRHVERLLANPFAHSSLKPPESFAAPLLLKGLHLSSLPPLPSTKIIIHSGSALRARVILRVSYRV